MCKEEATTDEESEANDGSKVTTVVSSRLREMGQRLRGAGVRTLVVDEAHHLRAQWWATLTGIAEALGVIHLIALTATPPYDAPAGEWGDFA